MTNPNENPLELAMRLNAGNPLVLEMLKRKMKVNSDESAGEDTL